MFTGIIERIGAVKEKKGQGKGVRLVLEVGKWNEKLSVGDSVAVNGACLTIVRKTETTLAFDVVPDTLKSTNLGSLQIGSRVNLEPSLRAGDAFGGHFVMGHVDAVGKIKKLEKIGDSWILEVEVPSEIMRYVIHKGSIAVDGISLTVQRVREKSFEIAIIPHTMGNTALGGKKAGDPVNLEPDFMAKYMEKYFLDYLGGAGKKNEWSEKNLREQGF